MLVKQVAIIFRNLSPETLPVSGVRYNCMKTEKQSAMNTLRLELEHQIKGGTTSPYDDHYWAGSLYVDDLFLNEKYAIDHMDLTQSAIEGGEYYILTCGCGDSGCAGLDEKVKVTHENGLIKWHITDPPPERHLEFTKEQYNSALLSFYQKVQTEVPLPTQEDDFQFGYYGFLPRHLAWCVKTLKTGKIVGTGYETP